MVKGILGDLKKISDQKDRLLKKMRRQTNEIEGMKSDWADATDSLAQQITDQQKEIKDLKDKIYDLKNPSIKVIENQLRTMDRIQLPEKEFDRILEDRNKAIKFASQLAQTTKEQKNRYENLKKENTCLKVTINNMVKRYEEKKDLKD